MTFAMRQSVMTARASKSAYIGPQKCNLRLALLDICAGLIACICVEFVKELLNGRSPRDTSPEGVHPRRIVSERCGGEDGIALQAAGGALSDHRPHSRNVKVVAAPLEAIVGRAPEHHHWLGLIVNSIETWLSFCRNVITVIIVFGQPRLTRSLCIRC